MLTVPIGHIPAQIVTQAGSIMPKVALIMVLKGSLLAVSPLNLATGRVIMAILAKLAIMCHNGC